MKVEIIKMKHTLTFKDDKNIDHVMPCWALVDTDGRTIQQVYSKTEPTDLKDWLEKPIENNMPS